MSPREYHYPKVVATKETSAHRKTLVHPVVPRPVAEKPEAPRPRAKP
jgi:hypothetical protein